MEVEQSGKTCYSQVILYYSYILMRLIIHLYSMNTLEAHGSKKPANQFIDRSLYISHEYS